jgi:DNA transformation protein
MIKKKFWVSSLASRVEGTGRVAKDESFKDFVLDQLQGLDDIEARRMFGGFGLYREEIFFGIVHRGRLYFKTDDSTVRSYRKYKMKPFRPNARQTLKSYYQVPVEVLEDADDLCNWAGAAIGCQTRSPHPNPRPFRGRRERTE